MKQRQTLLAGLAACGLVLFSPVSRPPTYSGSAGTTASINRMGSGDHTFADKAAQGGMAEVKLGELAKEKASSQAVKDFGERMITDHSKANDELKSVTGNKALTMPASLDAKDQATYDRLSKLSGAEFDKAYMRDMVSDHRADINEFRREANSGKDPDMKAFAAKTLPTLEEHLRLAESTESQVKAEK